MTMKVIVINDDAEQSRKLVVETVGVHAETGEQLSVDKTEEIEAGHHKEFWVHSTQSLKVKEIEK